MKTTARPPIHCTPKIFPLKEHGIKQSDLSAGARRVIAHLQNNGFVAYIVGGAVRDLLLHIQPKDFDVVTNATPEEVRQHFRRSRIIGKRFRIVHVFMGNEIIEITTFRRQGTPEYSANGRIMRDNNFGSCEEDALRRDFTINALLYDPLNENIIDYTNGFRDLQSKRIKMIGSAPSIRYQEDPIRILRALRFAAKLGFKIDGHTKSPIHVHVHLLSKEPPARLFEETLKFLLNGYASASFSLLHDEGLAPIVFPFLEHLSDKDSGHLFIGHALGNTDERIQAGKHISVGFLWAALLWPLVLEKWQHYLRQNKKTAQALLKAIEWVESVQRQSVSIPRRFTAMMREIWILQPRFNHQTPNRSKRLLKHPRFRAAFDFFCLRAENNQVPIELSAWWKTFVERESLPIKKRDEYND